MTFRVSKQRLLEALLHVRMVMPKGECGWGTLKNFVFTFPMTTVMNIMASDGEQWMQETVDTEEPVQDARPFAVWYHTLLSTLKGLDEQMLTFEVGEYQLTVKHSCGQFRVPIEDAKEFLDMKRATPNPDTCHVISYEAPGLKHILKQCSFAMAKDELRPVLNGVCVNLTKEYADYASSDGHKLVRIRKSAMMVDGKVLELTFVISSKVVNTLMRLLPKTGDVEIYYEGTDDNKAVAQLCLNANLTYTFRPVEGRYPNYMNVIPANFVYDVLVDKKSFVKSMERLANFTATSGLVRFEINKDEMRMSAQDTDFQIAGEEVLPIERTATASNERVMKQGLNVRHILSMLKKIGTEKVKMRIQDETRAMVVEPEPQPSVEEVTMVVMPMMISD